MLRKPSPKRLWVLLSLSFAGCGLAACDDSSLSPLTRSVAPIPPKTVEAMEAIGSSKNAPILIRTYKKEAEFEIWKMKADGHYAYLKSFPLCRWSGQLGPKVREGDRQVPEGFYSITPAHMNPKSAYYLSFDVGYPNAYDRAHGHTGESIMVHGACSSAGCFSMTDRQIAEIYAIAREAFAGGQRAIQMQSYPFRMTAENLAKYRLDPNIGFWKQLKEGADNFEVTQQDVATGVCNRHYVFNATPADGSELDPVLPCPALKRDATIQKEVAAKQARDEAKIAELAAQGVRPVKTVYADGGQNPAFASLASYASRPEALAKEPVEIALDEKKPKKTKMARAAKKAAIKRDLNAASARPPASNAKSDEAVAIAAANPALAAKPAETSFFSRLWGAKPAGPDAGQPQDAPAPSTAAAAAPLSAPAKRSREPGAPAEAKPAGTKAKPEKSVANPAAGEPHAALKPAGSVSNALAFLRPASPASSPAQQ
ncbi:MAG: murein L,D-transpeptidase [Methylocapsa sp.]|nr:murein L,D-transpeptidase [Methylocapsa sp.]